MGVVSNCAGGWPEIDGAKGCVGLGARQVGCCRRVGNQIGFGESTKQPYQPVLRFRSVRSSGKEGLGKEANKTEQGFRRLWEGSRGLLDRRKQR